MGKTDADVSNALTAIICKNVYLSGFCENLELYFKDHPMEAK